MVVQNRWLRYGFISAGAWLFIFIYLSCFSALAAEKAAAPAQVTWSIPHLTQAPKIDGDLSEWKNIVPVFLGVEKDQIRYYSLRPWAGPLDSSAKIWMGWDKDNLYFAADIRDDTFHQTCSSTDLGLIWSEDSLWLTVASPDKTKQNGTVVLLNEINWAIVTPGRAATVTKRGAEDYKAGAFPVAARKKPDGTGWICEGAVPWKEIPFSARAGAVLRLCWAVADSDTGSKALAVPLSEIDANIEPKYLNTNDLIALVWPRAVGNYYKPWNLALAKLSDTPPPADGKIAEDAALRAYQGLLKRYQAIKDVFPAEELLWTGHTYAFFGNMAQAVDSYKRILEEYPNNVVVANASAFAVCCLEMRGNFDATALKAKYPEKSIFSWIQYSMGKAFTRSNAISAALNCYEEAMLTAPDGEAALRSCEAFSDLFAVDGRGEFEAARERLRDIALKNKEAGNLAKFGIGKVYAAQGILQIAEEMFIQLLAVSPNNILAHKTREELASVRYALAWETGRFVGNKQKAVQYLAQSLMDLDSTNCIKALELIESWQGILGNYGEARRQFLQFSKNSTNKELFLWARYHAANCLARMGMIKQAISEYTALLQLNDLPLHITPSINERLAETEPLLSKRSK